MIQIKNILCDLADYAYRDNPKLEQYKHFYIEVSNENRKSLHGYYNEKTHHIRIFNAYRDDAAIIATTIHELAHHIDTCNRGRSDHSKEFYIVFEHLLKTALDMKLFNKEEFLAATADASDSGKIRNMIKDYEPVSVGYKENISIIRVHNCYDIKNELKERGYHYNSVEKAWETETDDAAAEERYLKHLKADISYDVSNNFMSFNRKSYICAGQGSYDIKDYLKDNGFFFDKKIKAWKKEGNSKDLTVYRREYPNVQWSII